MPSFKQFINESNFDKETADWLTQLISQWQIISDLAFADLVLWLPVLEDRIKTPQDIEPAQSFIVGAFCRPMTGVTLYYDDIDGVIADSEQSQKLQAALIGTQVIDVSEPILRYGRKILEQYIPVVLRGQTIAVICRQSDPNIGHEPNLMESSYLNVADYLISMIARGEFPILGLPPSKNRRGRPRVSDGFLLLDAVGTIKYSSPNAITAFHRLGFLGELIGKALVDILSIKTVDGMNDKTMMTVAAGKAPWRSDFENERGAISLQSYPLSERGVRQGALILCRDITDLRSRDRELITKDATIREIHHRVKNNLQMVSSLLRLQARRVEAPEAKAALNEAMRRISAVASIHEMLSQTLSETIDFDETFSQILRLLVDVAKAGILIQTHRLGRFGLLEADDATALALILAELATNSVEHGLVPNNGGNIWIKAKREADYLRILFEDDGIGLEKSESTYGSGLGKQIIETFIKSLNGSAKWTNRPGGGTRVTIKVELNCKPSE